VLSDRVSSCLAHSTVALSLLRYRHVTYSPKGKQINTHNQQKPFNNQQQRKKKKQKPTTKLA